MVWCSNCVKNVAGSRDETGFLYCDMCGKVLDFYNFSQDPTFTKDAGGQSQLSGNFVRSIQSNFSASRERTLNKAFEDMRYMRNGLNMGESDEIIRVAGAFYRIALERNFTRGRNTEFVQAACLYIACREKNKPYLLIDFSNYLRINVYVLGAVFLQLCKVLRLEEHPIVQKPVDPSLFIDKFTQCLLGGTKDDGMKKEVSRTALKIITSMKRDWMQTGRKPSGLCGAALYISALSNGVKCTKSDIEWGITSDEALSLEELPKRVVVLGGGYIAVEFASIWNGMGAKVDLCFRRELPLRGFDDEMRAVVARNLEARGINMHLRTNLTELIKTENGIKVITDHGEELLADAVLFATGRAPNTKRLNLKAVGVEVDRHGAVKVDDYSRTTVPSIWAIGDVTNRMNLTPVALMEGSYFANTVFGGEPTKPDYNFVPYAVFCIPPLSVVGLSEEEAVEKAKGDILVYTSSFNPMKNTISGRQEKTVMKLVVDGDTQKVLGASMCGPDAPEIMQGIAVALKCGATKQQFDSTVGIHPSAAEEFVTMRSVTRRIEAGSKLKTNL